MQYNRIMKNITIENRTEFFKKWVASDLNCYEGLCLNFSTLLLWNEGSYRHYVNKWTWLYFNKILFLKTGEQQAELGWGGYILIIPNLEN